VLKSLLKSHLRLSKLRLTLLLKRMLLSTRKMSLSPKLTLENMEEIMLKKK
jgi:hypothetical protein